MENILTLDVKDWLIVVSTLLGPILAVQAQKFIEQFRFRKQRKITLFEQLMATRASRLSQDHVNALNMIDLVFYGYIRFGRTVRSKTEKAILDNWKEYHDHLSEKVHNDQLGNWTSKGDEIFINLLFSIATDLKFSFDRVQLKKGSYSPIAHSDLEAEQMRLRRAMIDVLEGNECLKMNIELPKN